jgi:hypothetical protein
MSKFTGRDIKEVILLGKHEGWIVVGVELQE